MRKVLSFAAVILLLYAGCSKEENLVSGVQENKLKSTGSDHGYFWYLYNDGGKAAITFPKAGTYPGNFQVTYSNVYDVIGGKGWSTGSARTINYSIDSIAGYYDAVGVYGWTTNPLIEYYVTEKGYGAQGTFVGSMSSDGHVYRVYKYRRINILSVIGTATFWSYYSVWGSAPVGVPGKVTMTNHINFWKARCGQGFGAFNYQIFAVEALGGKSGLCRATVW